MITIKHFCGEEFVIVQDHKFGKCFEQLCIIYPIFCTLLISSAYYIAFRHIRHPKRPPSEYAVLTLRIFLSLIFSVIAFYSLYHSLYQWYTDETSPSVSSDLIQSMIISCTWVVHTVYLVVLLRGITSKLEGPFNLNICLLLCFSEVILHLYLQHRDTGFSSLKSSELIIIVCEIIYVLTLLPYKCLKNEDRTEHRINVISEEEPLLNSIPCNYSAFREESDPEQLGTAEDANVFSWLLLTWVRPLMVKGYHNYLKTVDDLFDLPDSLQVHHLSEKLSKFPDYRNFTNIDIPDSSHIHLFKKLHKLFKFEFYSIGVLKIISDCLLFGGPILLNALVSNLEDTENKNWKFGYYYALGLLLTTFLGSLFSTHYNYLINKISLKIKAAIIIMIYQKTLFTSRIMLSSMTSGEILNFISTDTDRIVNFCQSFHQSWSLPVQVIIALILLYRLLGYCFLIGIAFIVIVIPINQQIAKKIANYSTFLMLAKDKRIKVYVFSLSFKFKNYQNNEQH